MKIIRTRVKIKDINIKFVYNLLLNIKSWYICCGLHIKIFKKNPSQIHNVTRLQKPRYLIGRLRENFWFSSFDFSEVRQIRWVALRLCYLQWLSLVKFYPLDPPTLNFLADIHWDMSGNWINIYNLCYNTVVLKKKSLKLLQIALLGPYLGKNSASRGHAQNQVRFFFFFFFFGDNKRRS